MRAVGVEVHAGQRAGAERQRRRLLGGEAQARAVALEHPDVGEQVVARGRRAARAAGACSPAAASRGGARRRRPARAMSAVTLGAAARARLAREQRDVGGDLVVARARGVQPAADRPGDLGEPPLDGHVDVLVVGRERERARRAARPRPRRGRRGARRGPRSEMIPCAASMRACARDCATSWGHSRRSKPSDAFSAWKAGSCGSAKRDMRRRQSERSGLRRQSAIWATCVASAKPSR